MKYGAGRPTVAISATRVDNCLKIELGSFVEETAQVMLC